MVKLGHRQGRAGDAPNHQACPRDHAPVHDRYLGMRATSATRHVGEVTTLHVHDRYWPVVSRQCHPRWHRGHRPGLAECAHLLGQSCDHVGIRLTAETVDQYERELPLNDVARHS